jgi:hypothetical protein
MILECKILSKPSTMHVGCTSNVIALPCSVLRKICIVVVVVVFYMYITTARVKGRGVEQESEEHNAGVVMRRGMCLVCTPVCTHTLISPTTAIRGWGGTVCASDFYRV